MNIPLVHIQTSEIVDGKYQRGLANGIIAIGDIAYGRLLAIGGVSFGGIALGGIGIGVVGLGGMGLGIIGIGGCGLGLVGGIGAVAVGGLFALGTVSLSLIKSIGVIAVSLEGLKINGK